MKVVLIGLLAALIGYLLGSISFAVIVSRVHAKDDVRKHGSGNAGMTNVLRNYGKGPAAVTFLLDMGKGSLAVIIGTWLFRNYAGVPEELIAIGTYLAAAGALLGHIFPLYFGFRGGKGVATTGGIILATNPLVFVCLVIIFVTFTAATKMVSVGSIADAVSYPILIFLFRGLAHKPLLIDGLFAIAFCLLVIYMHRSNIRRIIDGTENKIGSGKK